MSDTSTQALGTERIPKLFREYAIPSVIAMLAAILYNLADRIFIGHGVGTLAIGALTISMPLMNILAAFGAMVGIGAASMISIKLGQSDKNSARHILGNAVILNLIIGLSMGALGLIFLDQILYAFGASPDTIGYAREYLQIQLIGNVVTHLYMGLNNILRATGYPRKSMAIMVTAVFINVVLDAVFIFVFGWGVRGAAIATVFAQVIAMILELQHFFNKKHEINFRKIAFRLKSKIISGILSIGAAPLLINIGASVVAIFINHALKNNGGDLYIAAYGLVNGLVMIFLMVIFGFNHAMQPIVGYNFGARKPERMKEALWLTVRMATVVTSLGFLIGMLCPRFVMRIFTPDKELLDVASHAFRVVVIAFPLVGYQIVASNFFQSIGKAGKAIFLSLTRQILFLVPLLTILPRFFGSEGVWYSMPIADFIATIITTVLLLRQIKQLKREEITI